MYYGARGIVGLVKPTYRPGSMESFIKLMPEGVGFIPAHAGIRAGNEQELQEALTVAEKKVARLAELGAGRGDDHGRAADDGARPWRGSGDSRFADEEIQNSRDCGDDRSGRCISRAGNEKTGRHHLFSRRL